MDNSTIVVDLLIDHVSTGAFGSPERKHQLRQLVTGHLGNSYDFLQLTNGHDFFAMLGIALREKFGKRLGPQTWQSEVQIHFRLAYSEEDFSRSDVFKAILQWQDEYHPYIILKPSLLN